MVIRVVEAIFISRSEKKIWMVYRAASGWRRALSRVMCRSRECELKIKKFCMTYQLDWEVKCAFTYGCVMYVQVQHVSITCVRVNAYTAPLARACPVTSQLFMSLTCSDTPFICIHVSSVIFQLNGEMCKITLAAFKHTTFNSVLQSSLSWAHCQQRTVSYFHHVLKLAQILNRVWFTLCFRTDSRLE